MTFTLPEELAKKFVRQVQARDRSRYVSDAIAEKLREREKRMIRACEVANQNSEVLSIEEDWDSITDKSDQIEEPWKSAPAG
jgi:hypothetical protein